MGAKVLTAKQARFCEEYLVDLNPTQAATRAGYSPRSARTIGLQLLALPHVQERVRVLIAARAARTQVTQDRVVEELARIALSDIRNVLSWDEQGRLQFTPSDQLTEVQAAAVSAVTFEKRYVRGEMGTQVELVKQQVKLYDKGQALQLLGKHLGMWRDEEEKPTQLVIQVNTGVPRAPNDPPLPEGPEGTDT